jgi:hypothetical protein
MSLKCEYCPKSFTGLNQENINRHNNKHINKKHQKITNIKPINSSLTKTVPKQAATSNLASLLNNQNEISVGDNWADLEHRCGFCGIECNKRIELCKTSGAGLYATEGIAESSICDNGKWFTLKPAKKISKRTPCTNRPVNCKVCLGVFWSYNILIHYSNQHSHLTCDETCHPSEDEIIKVKASKY